MAMDLSDIRKKIDEIDKDLLTKFIERMDCTRQVAEYKTEHNIPVLNSAREQEILDSVAEKSGTLSNATVMLFRTIMNISRGAQYPIVTKNSPVHDELKAARAMKFNPKKIGFQGTDGSYSQIAAKKLFGNAESMKNYQHFEDVFKAVANGEIDCGVLPAENSYAGSVSENYDNLLKYDLKINRMIDLPISHCLLVKPNVDISKIKCVYSHVQALNQCRDYIDSHGYESVPLENTAFAARFVAQSDDENVAAIASRDTAELYGLKIVDSDIQAAGQNYTRFMAIAKNLSITDDADTVSIAFSIPHSSGSLYSTLSMLAANGMNMTRIESRPDKDTPFRYIFYVDFIGSVDDERTAALICGLHDELPFMRVLGCNKIIDKKN